MPVDQPWDADNQASTRAVTCDDPLTMAPDDGDMRAVSSSLRARSAAARLDAEEDTSRTRPSWSRYLARAWIAPLERVTKPIQPNVRSGSGKYVVTNEKVIFKETDGVGKECGLRLFGKGGALVYENTQ